MSEDAKTVLVRYAMIINPTGEITIMEGYDREINVPKTYQNSKKTRVLKQNLQKSRKRY